MYICVTNCNISSSDVTEQIFCSIIYILLSSRSTQSYIGDPKLIELLQNTLFTIPVATIFSVESHQFTHRKYWCVSAILSVNNGTFSKEQENTDVLRFF